MLHTRDEQLARLRTNVQAGFEQIDTAARPVGAVCGGSELRGVSRRADVSIHSPPWLDGSDGLFRCLVSRALMRARALRLTSHSSTEELAGQDQQAGSEQHEAPGLGHDPIRQLVLMEAARDVRQIHRVDPVAIRKEGVPVLMR